MSEYPDLDAEEQLTPEQRAKASAERMDQLLHFTPEEKTRWEAGILRDRMIDIQLEAERLERAEKEIRSAAYQRRKAKKEELVAGMEPEARVYYKNLEQALRLLRKYPPPKELPENAFLRIKAEWDLIFSRLQEFVASRPAPVAEKGSETILISDYSVTKGGD